MPKKHPVRPHLRAWRDSLGKTQEWLANEIGTAHSTVLRAEQGTTGVDDKTFAAIAKAYGITIAELSAPPEDAPRARALHDLMIAAQDLDDRQLGLLAAMAAEFFVKK